MNSLIRNYRQSASAATEQNEITLAETIDSFMLYFEGKKREHIDNPSRPIDYPASETYNKWSPEQVKALCEINIPGNQTNRIMPPWEKMTERCRRFFRKKAYWALRGAEYPTIAAFIHVRAESRLGADNRVGAPHGWTVEEPWRPKSLRELERKFLTAPVPNIHLIIKRCPQMAMIQALRGDVSEPYWWAVLSITEHASPNLSRVCSDGYAGFSDDELNERVNRIQTENMKPALCSRIDSVNPNVCSACKFSGSIRSPIALGFEHEPKLRRGFP